jgi:hypothetical protein
MYTAINEVVTSMGSSDSESRIRAVLMSDGADSGSAITLHDATQAISASSDALNPTSSFRLLTVGVPIRLP